ncbi:MAG: beta-hydroxyacyl-ACP dehydratase [Puniceicoccales bacterium]|jgi:3-hydroxyacyl-[acyl-carrier-protein] dehydratase|nr:beta-hydroxyacyl-ACP dehydratase [Puniceicoccales bacterium]
MIQEILETIPHRPPFLFVDDIVALRDDGATCARTFRDDEFFYAGHYPANPLTPGVLLCEAVFQAGAVFLVRKIVTDATAGDVPVLCRIEEAKFKGMVFPGDTVMIDVTLREKMQGFFFMSGKVSRAGRTMLTLRFALALVAREKAATSNFSASR